MRPLTCGIPRLPSGMYETLTFQNIYPSLTYTSIPYKYVVIVPSVSVLSS